MFYYIEYNLNTNNQIFNLWIFYHIHIIDFKIIIDSDKLYNIMNYESYKDIIINKNNITDEYIKLDINIFFVHYFIDNNQLLLNEIIDNINITNLINSNIIFYKLDIYEIPTIHNIELFNNEMDINNISSSILCVNITNTLCDVIRHIHKRFCTHIKQFLDIDIYKYYNTDLEYLNKSIIYKENIDIYFDKEAFLLINNYTDDDSLYSKYLKDIRQKKNYSFDVYINSLCKIKDYKYILLVNHCNTLYGANHYLYLLFNYLKNKYKNIKFILCEVVYQVDLYYKYNIELDDIVIYHNDPTLLYMIYQFYDPLCIYLNSCNNAMVNVYKYIESDKLILHSHEEYNDYLLSNIINPTFVVSTQIKNKYKNNDNILIQPPIINIENILKFVNDPIDFNNIKNKIGVINLTKINIGMCGELTIRKNYNLFIKVSEAFPQYNFIWIGGNSNQSNIFNNYKNIYHIPFENNPYKYFKQLIDYFILFSQRDPCPYVILENILLENTIITFKENISYNHKHKLTKKFYYEYDGEISYDTCIKCIIKYVSKKKNNKIENNGYKYISEFFTKPYIVTNYLYNKYNIGKKEKHDHCNEPKPIVKYVYNILIYIYNIIKYNEDRNIINPIPIKYLYNIIIYTIVKDESHIIKEWILHNIFLGVEMIYIYDDQSIIPVSDLIIDFPNEIKKKITIFRIDIDYYDKNFDRSIYFDPNIYKLNNINKQLYYMNLFTTQFRNISNWCLFIDCDEFIYLKDDNLLNIIKLYDNYDSIYIPWLMYSNSYLINEIDGLIINNLTYHAANYDKYLGKSIIKLSKIKFIDNNHQIDKHLNTFHFDNTTKIYELPIHINHYHITSIKTYLRRKLRPEVGYNNCNLRQCNELLHTMLSIDYYEVNDDKMFKYIDKINKILKVKINKLNTSNDKLCFALYHNNNIITNTYKLHDYNLLHNIKDNENIRYCLKTELIPSDFNIMMYKQLNNDLPNTTDNALLYHYYIYGSIENRKYK